MSHEDAAAAVADPAERSTSRPRSSREALEYLALSGAVAISVRPTEAGSKIIAKCDPGAAVVGWCSEKNGKPVIRLAQRILEKEFALASAADVVSAESAVRKAANDLQALLTPHETAISRATASVARLEALVDDMRQNGQIAEFNRMYKRGRAAAAARGARFMTYNAAMTRLRRALVPLLVGGDRPAPGKLLAEIFGG